MRWVERFAFLHPIWLLIALVGYFAVSLVLGPAVTTGAPALIPAIAILGIALPLLWMTGLRAVARRALGLASWSVWSWASPAVPVLLLVAVASLNVFPALAAAALLGATIAYFSVIWVTARALATFQRGAGATALTIGTALLLIYYFIGAWVLRPVVRELKATTSA